MNFKLPFLLLLLFGLTALASAPVNDEIDLKNRSLNRILKKKGFASYEGLHQLEMGDSLKLRYGVQGNVFLADKESEGIKYIYIGRVNSCRAGGCSRPGVTNNENPEYFEYCVFYDEWGTVSDVRVYNYRATHGYEITAKSWLKQFIGYRGNDLLEVNKTVDGISGATISVHAITRDIELKTALVQILENHPMLSQR